MTVGYFAGFDLAKVGTISIDGTDAGGGWAAFTISTGTFTHVATQSCTPVSAYLLLATRLQTEINAASAGAQTYTVTFSPTTGHYTITVSAGSFDMTFGNAFTKSLLGFSADQTNVSSAVSDQIAYYGIIASVNARSSISWVYQQAGATKVAVADDGTPYHATRTTTPKLLDWRQVYETKAKVFDEFAATPNMMAWRAMFSHLATGEHLSCYDSNYSKYYVGKLREDGCALTMGDTLNPSGGDPNYDAYWDVTLKTHYLGEV